MREQEVAVTDEPQHKQYEWADELFSNKYDIDPKYRDMLAMLASAMMGNPGAVQHFYDQAIIDGAQDAELQRVVQLARSSLLELGDRTTNAANAVEEIRADQSQNDHTGTDNAPPSSN
jgi:alkylhydroperoxidase/carboxymuconolactone decarboxylase family protein YurZ